MNAEFSRTLSLLRQEKGVSQRTAAGVLGPRATSAQRKRVCSTLRSRSRMTPPPRSGIFQISIPRIRNNLPSHGMGREVVLD